MNIQGSSPSSIQNPIAVEKTKEEVQASSSSTSRVRKFESGDGQSSSTFERQLQLLSDAEKVKAQVEEPQAKHPKKESQTIQEQIIACFGATVLNRFNDALTPKGRAELVFNLANERFSSIQHLNAEDIKKLNALFFESEISQESTNNLVNNSPECPHPAVVVRHLFECLQSVGNSFASAEQAGKQFKLHKPIPTQAIEALLSQSALTVQNVIAKL